LQPQLYYYLGGFGLLSEYGKNEDGLQKGIFRTDMGFRAWQVEASYILTGEKGFRSEKRRFGERWNWRSASEVSARIALSTPTDSPPRRPHFEAHERVAGVNWYLNRLLKIAVDYGNTDFGGGNTILLGGNKPEEKVVTIRLL
jgi:phosphate-selective porin OprO/OprP